MMNELTQLFLSFSFFVHFFLDIHVIVTTYTTYTLHTKRGDKIKE
jgi:hypothetical protein